MLYTMYITNILFCETFRRDAISSIVRLLFFRLQLRAKLSWMQKASAGERKKSKYGE